MANHIRYRPGTPTFISDREPGSCTDSKRGNDIETECCRVVVINEEDNVRRIIFEPFSGGFKALKQRCPVRLLRFILVDSDPNRRDMRGIDAGTDSSNQPCSFSPV
jgi:hypothetical protein